MIGRTLVALLAATWLISTPLAAEETKAPVAKSEAAAESQVESKYLSNIKQVTSGFTKAGEGYFSPDGQTWTSAGQPLPGMGVNKVVFGAP